MTDPSDAVDRYLAAVFRTRLEQVLLDIAGGKLNPVLAGAVETTCRRIDQRRHPDGGVTEGFAGTVSVQGVAYDCRFWLFVDGDGTRFLTDLSVFAPVGWQTRLGLGQGIG
jgi:hypothetical protein